MDASHPFELVSPFHPTGDQPQAIDALVEGLSQGKKEQVLEGATGTGKTFTMANVIARVQRPTLVFSHNKTLAGQLYSEFKELFPHNRVEYFVSNFDYYQPEAYMPKTDQYIEKTAAINEELDMFRESALNSLLERRDTIVVASVACIYAASDPKQYKDMFFTIRVGEEIERNALLRKFIDLQYRRNDVDQTRGTLRVRGDVIEVTPSYTNEFNIRIEMFGDEVDRITEVDPTTGKTLQGYQFYNIFPASGYARSKESMNRACDDIEAELEQRLKYFHDNGKELEAERLEQRTRFDLEALRENGYCAGIENYSMHIDGRKPGQRPWNLFDYFPKDFLLFVDESHVSLPQIRGMYNGDRQRKEVLVKYGFRLPSALDNRPMRFEEFEGMLNQVIYCSATPGDYELDHVHHQVVEQIIRPTGLLDPKITVKPTHGQVDDICEAIEKRIKRNERVLITTLTVRMAEDLTEYLKERGFKVSYLHHETKTLERSQVIHDLRAGKIDVIVGINLLREGLDIPEVSLVCILDADKEGFLRSERSLVQTIGRAARNANGEVYMYADVMTDSMKAAISETNRRRRIQEAYNTEHGIVPKTISKPIEEAIRGKETQAMAARYVAKKAKLSKKDRATLLNNMEAEMKEAAKQLDFERAAELRDMLFELRAED
ncbi:excinuclease ABC subunit UvrB [Galactobacillus timonensis]|uniref:excinuclease ABC subunit UvrB n=1 Tax=Galactobacillus timonensis TaxID=2041840 RepID=UPI00240A81F3|nr:excinuclease ABC subunit UvrB [Galactobacillus timonensis]MDD6681203.1 excinuclease ABC subunit UvrB [Galactobacillus timonensis]